MSKVIDGFDAWLAQDGQRPVRVYAEGRLESEACERGTDGCSIDHSQDRGSCETW